MKNNFKTLFAVCATLAGVWTLQGQSLNQAVRSVDSDLDAALKELAQLRDVIATERIPLSQDVEAIEADVMAKTSELSREQSLRDNRELGLQQLTNEVKSKQEEIEYIGGLLRDFVRAFTAQIHVAEKQLYSSVTKEAETAALANVSQKELFDAQLEVVDTALNRLNQAIGGYAFEGRAIVSGERVPGRFALVGPTVYFRDDAAATAGIAVAEASSGEAVDATIVTAVTFKRESIAELIDSGKGSLPLDATLGGAILVEQNRDTLASHLAQGGVVGYVILSLGGVTLLIAVFKIYSITTFRVPNGNFILELAETVKKGQKDVALAKAKSFGGLAGEMFEEAVANSDQPRGLIEEYLSVKIMVARRQLESLLPFVAIIAAASPLLGLLGTVVGMIKTFKLITVFGTGDARSLSSGISEALVTTELGLWVAIPSLILHGILNRMARTKWGQLEQDSIVFLNDVKED
jgi:biopolymer transport protein ExbB